MGVIEIVKKHAKEDKAREMIKNLITKLNLSDEKVAPIAGMNVDFVREVRSELEQE